MISLGIKYSMCIYWITSGQRVWFHATNVKAKIYLEGFILYFYQCESGLGFGISY